MKTESSPADRSRPETTRRSLRLELLATVTQVSVGSQQQQTQPRQVFFVQDMSRVPLFFRVAVRSFGHDEQVHVLALGFGKNCDRDISVLQLEVRM